MRQVKQERRIPEVPSDKEAAVILKEFGLDPRHVKQWKRKLINLRCHAPSRSKGGDCYLTFKQYVRLAVKAGLKSPDQIGRTKGKYQMARIGDVGDYSYTNCRFLTIEDNQAEKHVNGGYASQSAKQKAKGATEAILKAVALAKEARVKKFRVQSPSGKTYTGTDLKAFCAKHDLPQSSMSFVCRGGKVACRGWTGAYT